MSVNGVDLAEFPEVVRNVLQDYPSVRESVNTFRQVPDFDETYRPSEVNVYLDDCWVAGWTALGQVDAIPHLVLPAKSRPEVVEIEVDGEPGLLLVLGIVVLNRIEKIPGHELWMVDLASSAA